MAGAPFSRISRAYPARVEVRGRDLSRDLMGRWRASRGRREGGARDPRCRREGAGLRASGSPAARPARRANSRARAGPARPSGRGAAAAARPAHGRRRRGGDRVPARTGMMLEPEVEGRPWAEQLAVDDASYRSQLAYLFERSRPSIARSLHLGARGFVHAELIEPETGLPV